MPPLQPSMHHLTFEAGNLWSKGESEWKALHPCFRPCHLSECGSYRKETDLSPLSWIDLFFDRHRGL